MGLVDEIRELKQLRDDGTLSEAEFEQAKATLLAGSSSGRDRPTSRSLASDPGLGAAAQSWVKHQKVMGIVTVILMLLFFFGFFLPQWKKMGADHDQGRNMVDKFLSSEFGR